MKKFHFNLQMFDSSYTVTCHAGANMTAFSASPASGAKDTEVTLTVTPASNYTLDEIEVIAGGVTITETSGTYKFAIGEANVVLYAKAKKANNYMVTEECVASVNDSKVVLHQNTKVTVTPNGVPVKVEAISGGQVIADSAAVQELVAQGILVKI